MKTWAVRIAFAAMWLLLLYGLLQRLSVLGAYLTRHSSVDAYNLDRIPAQIIWESWPFWVLLVSMVVITCSHNVAGDARSCCWRVCSALRRWFRRGFGGSPNEWR